jgi:hypothetical protein
VAKILTAATEADGLRTITTKVGDKTITRFERIAPPTTQYDLHMGGATSMGKDRRGKSQQNYGSQQYGGYGGNYNYDAWYGYGKGKNGGGTGTGVTTYQRRPDCGFVVVVDGNDKMLAQKVVPGYDDEWWELAQQVYGPAADGKTTTGEPCKILWLKPDSVWLHEEAPAFFPCVYNAAETYVSSWHGMKLHEDDLRWAKYHPWSKEDGVPQEHMVTVLHGLVEPYGLGVSRVRFRAGTLQSGQQLPTWMKALGMNPFAMYDHTTTNAQAAERMGISLADANELWRVEFHEDPLTPSIVGERGHSGSGVGATGGHSRYLSPRGRGGDWVVSVQLARLDRITYLSQPELPEYTSDTRRRGRVTFELRDVRKPDGTKLAELRNGHWYDPSATPASTAATVSSAPGSSVETLATPASGSEGGQERSKSLASLDVDEAAFQQEVIECVSCHTTVLVAECVPGLAMCGDCYSIAWETYRCGSCKVDFGPKMLPTPSGDDDDPFRCPNPACQSVFGVDVKDRKQRELQEALDQYEETYNEFLDQLEEDDDEEGLLAEMRSDGRAYEDDEDDDPVRWGV